MDNIDKATRARIMAKVGQRDTKPELCLRSILHGLGLRYRLYDRTLPGTPDIVFPKYKSVVFVHGCFWHAHEGCKYATVPKTRKDFWLEKFAANRKRDRKNYDALLKGGWKVLVVWECAIKGKKEPELRKVGEFVKNWLESDESFGEIGADVSLEEQPQKSKLD